MQQMPRALLADEFAEAMQALEPNEMRDEGPEPPEKGASREADGTAERLADRTVRVLRLRPGREPLALDDDRDRLNAERLCVRGRLADELKVQTLCGRHLEIDGQPKDGGVCLIAGRRRSVV